jgi:hypothetical protein
MFNLKVIALTTALALSTAGIAVGAESAIDALSSANIVSFQTVSSPSEIVTTADGSEAVDIEALKALIQQTPKLLAQLETYGATIDDVVGVTATDETDVTIYVLG